MFKLTDFNARTQNQIRRQLASDLSARYPGQVAKLESNPSNAPLAKKEVQRQTSERFLVRIESRRKRLIDEDNICEKYIVDLLRYSGVIPDDAPAKCKIEVSQSKCGKGEPETTTIEVSKV